MCGAWSEARREGEAWHRAISSRGEPGAAGKARGEAPRTAVETWTLRAALPDPGGRRTGARSSVVAGGFVVTEGPDVETVPPEPLGPVPVHWRCDHPYLDVL